MIDEELQWFKSIQGLDICDTSRDISFCGHAILQDDLFVINDASTDVRFFDNPLVSSHPNVRFYAGYPIRARNGYKIGTLCIMDNEPRYFAETELELLKDFAGIVEDIVHNHKYSELQKMLLKEMDEAKRKKFIDVLTKLWNRQALENIIAKNLLFAKAQDKPFGLGIIDIDDFQFINDEYSHDAGSKVLRKISKILLDCFRMQDIIGRWSGKKFVVVIESDQKKLIKSILERARKRIEQELIYYDTKKFKTTITIGAVFVEPKKCVNAASLIEASFSALKQGKISGKNRFVICELDDHAN